MFKALFEFVDGADEVPAEGSPVAKLIADIDKMPFLADLDEATLRIHGKKVAELKAEGRCKDIIAAIIRPEGLNYPRVFSNSTLIPKAAALLSRSR